MSDEYDNKVASYAWAEIEQISELLRPFNARQCTRIFEEAMKKRRQFWRDDRKRGE